MIFTQMTTDYQTDLACAQLLECAFHILIPSLPIERTESLSSHQFDWTNMLSLNLKEREFFFTFLFWNIFAFRTVFSSLYFSKNDEMKIGGQNIRKKKTEKLEGGYILFGSFSSQPRSGSATASKALHSTLFFFSLLLSAFF